MMYDDLDIFEKETKEFLERVKTFRCKFDSFCSDDETTIKYHIMDMHYDQLQDYRIKVNKFVSALDMIELAYPKVLRMIHLEAIQ